MRGLAVRHPDVQVAFILLGGQPGHLDVIIAFIFCSSRVSNNVNGHTSLKDMVHQKLEITPWGVL